jgi:hypothetical protein
LAASLEGKGLLRVREAWFANLELTPAVAGTAAELNAGIETRPFAVTTRFQVGAGQLRLDQFLLDRPGEQIAVTGSVDFARRLDLRFQSQPRSVTTAVGLSAKGDAWTVGGTLDAPSVTSLPVAGPPGIRAGNGLPLASR